MRHVAPSKSNSVHSALRSSPGRTKTSGASRSAHRTTNDPLYPLIARSSAPTSLGPGQGRVMPFLNGRQRAAQIAGRIALRASRRDGVAEDLPAYLLHAMRGFERAAASIRRRTASNSGGVISPTGRAPATGKRRAQHAGLPSRHGTSPSPRKISRTIRAPRPRTVSLALPRLFDFALNAGINACRYQLARRVALVARLLHANLRIGAERKQPFLAAEAVLRTPPFSPGWGDEQVEAASRRTACGLLRRVWRCGWRCRKASKVTPIGVF